jgi:cell pole-organizing protein PopZ
MASHAAELKAPQAGAAQREPSMEEILASIRRIIEDSDQVRKPDDVAPVRDAEPERIEMVAANAPKASFELPRPARPPFEEPTGLADRLDPFHAGLRASVEAARPEPAVSARSPEPVDPVASAAIPGVPAGPDAVVADAGRASADTGRASRNAVSASRNAVGASLDTVGMSTDAVGVSREALTASTDAGAAAKAEPVAAAAPAAVEKASLMSERTGRQVAAAFGELTEAFEASRRKTFDELAAEMMRPMLQDWLDNNLPTLVEKLVREEIERVARGGR